MSEHYTQTVNAVLPKGARRNQILGVALKLAGIGLILAAVFANYYIFFAVAALLALGIYFTQRFYSAPKQYEYDFNTRRLLISRVNLLNRRNAMLEIAFCDVVEFGIFSDIVFTGDICAVSDIHSSSVRYLEFKIDNERRRLLFEPDNYLTALINDILRITSRERRLEEGQ